MAKHIVTRDLFWITQTCDSCFKCIQGHCHAVLPERERATIGLAVWPRVNNPSYGYSRACAEWAGEIPDNWDGKIDR